MDEHAFVDVRKDSWREFSEVLEKLSEQGPRSLGRDELRTFGQRYRSVVSDLSFARSHGASEALVAYLNELAGRAHGALYASRPARLKGILSFLGSEFPAVFRASAPYVIAAAVIFGLGAFAGAELVRAGYDTGEWSLPTDIDPARFSSYIMTNNIKVTILAFASGITAGVLTVWVLFYNGAFLAAVAASQNPARSLQLWTFVLPHGVIELTAIFTAGGAGLLIGSAIIAPGTLRRADALRMAAGRALRLFAGTIALLAVAGVIEGFISPSPLPRWSKIAFSGLTALALFLYLGFAGRSRTPADHHLTTARGS